MKANTGPLDLWHILQKRRVSFERWCEENNVRTFLDFLDVFTTLHEAGEYFMSNEMVELGNKLPMPEDLPDYVPYPPFPLRGSSGKFTSMSNDSEEDIRNATEDNPTPALKAYLETLPAGKEEELEASPALPETKKSRKKPVQG